MEVDHRGLQRAVAEVLLDQPEVDAGLEQVGRVTMSERVDRDGLAESQLADDAAQGALDAGALHGAVGGGGPAVVAAGGGEEPGRMAMGGPVFAEGLQRARRQRDEAVLGALAVVDVDHHRAPSMSPTWRWRPSPRRRPSE